MRYLEYVDLQYRVKVESRLLIWNSGLFSKRSNLVTIAESCCKLIKRVIKHLFIFVASGDSAAFFKKCSHKLKVKLLVLTLHRYF